MYRYVQVISTCIYTCIYVRVCSKYMIVCIQVLAGLCKLYVDMCMNNYVNNLYYMYVQCIIFG